MIRTLGALVGAVERAPTVWRAILPTASPRRARRAAQLSRRPKVYFEEWDEPMISGIGWVSELIEAAGGNDIFADRAASKSAKDRIVTARGGHRARARLIIGSWCGKKFRPEKVAARPGFDRRSGGAERRRFEIKSPLILQPGPAALTDGLAALSAIIAGASKRALWSTDLRLVPENFNQMIGRRRACRLRRVAAAHSSLRPRSRG